ncbi:MAG TPA: neuraminidase-like domain-containing protein [Crinalium sp.]|jgi:hypothetical protein
MANNDWLQISQQLHDELNVIKRDVLVPYVISAEANIENERDLYEELLIDVEMGSCGKTSKIEEAIAATQLYFHRYFVNLESVSPEDPSGTKHKLKTYWQWMKNYRVWEANRKVFLYPENYIRPELRDTKTPAFKTLEDDLLQGEITEEAAQRVYQKYLDEYTEVSRLTIAGGYVYDSTDMSGNSAKSLVLFGRTKTDPRRYYYQMAQFLGREKATTWSPWLKVGTQIDADKVYPVFAFNRVFVFWVKIETIVESPKSTALTTTETSVGDGKGKSQMIDSTPQSATHVLRIFFSFYNLNKEWVPAQTFRPKDDNAEKVEITMPLGITVKDIKNLGLLVETSDKLSVPGSDADGDHENIIVQCTYEVPVTEYDIILIPSLAEKALPATGERLFAIGRDNKGALSIRAFDHQENQVVDIQESAIKDKDVQLTALKAGLLPFWSGALPMTPENKRAILDVLTIVTEYAPRRPQAGQSKTIVCYRTFSLTPELYTVKLWNQPAFENASKVFRAIFDEPDIPVDQMVTFNTVQQSSEGAWFSFDYKGGSFLCKPDVGILPQNLWPKQISANKILPQWMIDAAVQLPNRKTFFFQKSTAKQSSQTYVSATAFPGSFSAEIPIKTNWGKINNNIQSTGVVNSAYVDRDSQKTYLFSGNQYVVYSTNGTGGYSWVDLGYPKLISDNTNFPSWNKPTWNTIDAVFQGKDRKTYFFNNTTKTYLVSGSSVERDTKTDWGTITKSQFITGLNPSANDSSPSIDAGFVYNSATYLLNRNQVVKYSGSDYLLIDAGYPKPHNLLDLLTELGYTAAGKSDAEKASLKNEKVVAAYNQGTDLYFFTDTNKNNYEYKSGQLNLVSSNKNEWTAGFAIADVVYQFNGTQLTISNSKDKFNLNQTIHAALVGTDNKIYLFRKSDYISLPKAGITPQTLVAAINAWSGSQTNEEKWGKVGDNIARTGQVDAAFCDGEKTYLFSGDEYLVYSGNLYTTSRTSYPDSDYPKKLNTNTEKFPQWDRMLPILQTINGTSGRGTIYYFRNSDQTYAESNPNLGNLPSFKSTIAQWGRVRNNISERGIVDSAFIKGGYLFLTSGDQIFRYTIQESGQNPNPTLDATLSNFVDSGYPKPLNWGVSRIDAAFTLDGKTYLFSGNSYCRLTDLQNNELRELTTLPTFKPIQRNWGNLPKQLMSGMDGAFNVPREGAAQDLYLFQGDRYIKYQIENETSAQPFEIEDARYEIVRLTTSTAYRLNQEFFAGGLPRLLSLATQEIDDTPSFSFSDSQIPSHAIATTIKVKPNKVSAKLPSSSHLDFSSANGIYYWEIFFHAPFLIAQALNLGQQFEAAKTWYEYIYDPTGVSPYWKFLPFVATDIPTIADVHDALIDAYLTDPFDPHAIAALRPMAYRKAIVMAYLDNLLDWGDMLFQQYTRESINEARMLYILAYDLLGAKPENLGREPLSPDLRYSQLGAYDGSPQSDQLVDQQIGNQTSNDQSHENTQPIAFPSLGQLIVGDGDYDFLVYPLETPIGNTPNASVLNPYFFVPENVVLIDYWSRVEDRLYKIRHCLNILGISQPLPLFEPPIDPMALVRAVSTGAGLSSAIASLNIPVPHYRFEFMWRKAQDLAQKLSQFGNDLLSALEKKDAEELSLLQNRQEGIILNLTRSIKEAQLEEAKYSRQALEESLIATTYQRDHYQGLLDAGLTALESAQIAMMITASALMTGAGIVKVAGAIVYGVPQFTIGPFSFGSTTGGQNWGESLSKISEALETSGDGVSMIGEAIGIYAQHERSTQDWTLQKTMADSEIKQLNLQIKGAFLQETMAQRELEILEQQIAHNESVSTYMRDKFSNSQLYQWMASKLSGLYYQTYQMAFDMAKAAEKAFQFERGMKESEVNFISGPYWDSQRKGLLAGDSLGLDLDRMEKAYIDSNRRGFEITKNISLLDLDPVALLQLKTKGVCEFSLTENLFDYDFPGHYCRQIRTLSLSFDFGEGSQTVMATLTQLNHKTVLEPDPKAVKYLLDPKDQPPLSIRNGWKANQQIALSHVEEGEKNNGLFELRFDDDRYLPFENTGAVSTWRLELNGKKNSYNINALRDLIINLKYTAEQGGQVFASVVKGLLKPYPTARFFDVAQAFPDEWSAFLESEDDELVLPMSRGLFPNMSSSKITGMFAVYDLAEPSTVSMMLNGDKNLTLKQGKFLQTNGLNISNRGSEWMFTVNGDKEILNNIGLVFSYKASVT